jgi:hypothetical protein
MSSVQIPFVTTTGISLSDAPIINVGEPVNLQDAATKNFSENASNITKGVLAIEYGGTGSTTIEDILVNIGAAKSGSNSDITSLSGLTTALSVAQGGTGLTSVPGSNGQILFNSSGAYSATSSISYSGSTLTIGSSDTTFTISGAGAASSANSGASIVIVGGISGNPISGGSPGHVYLRGGPGGINNGTGGNVYLQSGVGPDGVGSVIITTGSSQTERVRFTSSGAWGLSGANYGTSGQVLTSNGNGSSPTWTTITTTNGTVTSIDISGGTTGLTTTGGPITDSGTITLDGTLAVANGGTGKTSFSSGYLKSDGTELSSSATVSGEDISGNISGSAANVTGTVAVANGGTGATSAAEAAANLLPSQTGNNGKYLTTDGAGVLTWAAIATAGGLDFGTFEQPAGFYLDMGTF